MRLWRVLVRVRGRGRVHVFGPLADPVQPRVVGGCSLRGPRVHVAVYQAVGRLRLQEPRAQDLNRHKIVGQDQIWLLQIDAHGPSQRLPERQRPFFRGELRLPTGMTGKGQRKSL